MASALMTVPPKRRARARARADLPLAVGPAMITACRCRSSLSVLPVTPMSYIVTLVANRQAGSLSQADATRALEFCAGMHPNWLSPGHAVEFTVQAVPDRAALQAALEHKAVDVFVAKFRGRRKAVLVADMDSTIVTSETLDELAAYAGIKDKIAEITRRSMNGELDFPTALRERVAMLKGLKISALEETWHNMHFCR